MSSAVSTPDQLERLHTSIWLTTLLGKAHQHVFDYFQSLFFDPAMGAVDLHHNCFSPRFQYSLALWEDLPYYSFFPESPYPRDVYSEETPQILQTRLEQTARYIGNGFGEWQNGSVRMIRLLKFFLERAPSSARTHELMTKVLLLEALMGEMPAFYCYVWGYGYPSREMHFTEITLPPYVQDTMSHDKESFMPLLDLLVQLSPLLFLEKHILGSFYSYYQDQLIPPISFWQHILGDAYLLEEFWQPIAALYRPLLLPEVQRQIRSCLDPADPNRFRVISDTDILRFRFFESLDLAMFVDRTMFRDFYFSHQDPETALARSMQSMSMAHTESQGGTVHDGIPQYYLDDNNDNFWS